MMKFNRIFLIVCDSLGIGNAKDANKYDSIGANTLKSIADKFDLNIPCLEKLGLGLLGDFKGISKIKKYNSFIGKLNEVSLGKDTITGHLEMMGLETRKPFVTFTNTGFPDELLNEFCKLTNRGYIGNIACSGTEILDKYGNLQKETGKWIIYTSADSVFQIAANEEIIPLEELYNACKIARKLTLNDKYKVGRIIARPYIEKDGKYFRTSNRHDYALDPFDKTVLDDLKSHNLDVISIGKIADIFNNCGITKAIKSKSNKDGMNKTIDLLSNEFKGLCFVNLVDFDSMFDHRRDPIGYGKAINQFDEQLQIFIDNMSDDDLLIITADHGNDPTYTGTDHTREQVPLIVYNKQFKENKIFSDFDNFACIGASILENFNIKNNHIGKSFIGELK